MAAWSTAAARSLAGEYLAGLGDRWAHVRAVGEGAESLFNDGVIGETIVVAAWLHDLGYAEPISVTGLHALDGARLLEALDAPQPVVSLVAFHSGAKAEAAERGLANELLAFERPSQSDLDVLTFLDLTVGPSGVTMGVAERLSEILERYAPAHPVHRAVSRSRDFLMESAARGAHIVGQPM
jgi:hypothetical protein